MEHAKAPELDFTNNTGLLSRFDQWEKKVKILLGTHVEKASDESKAMWVQYWAGDEATEFLDELPEPTAEPKVKDVTWILVQLRKKCMPQSSDLAAVRDLIHLKQGSLTADQFVR
jgi:hypothetical protein